MYWKHLVNNMEKQNDTRIVVLMTLILFIPSMFIFNPSFWESMALGMFFFGMSAWAHESNKKEDAEKKKEKDRQDLIDKALKQYLKNN